MGASNPSIHFQLLLCHIDCTIAKLNKAVRIVLAKVIASVNTIEFVNPGQAINCLKPSNENSFKPKAGKYEKAESNKPITAGNNGIKQMIIASITNIRNVILAAENDLYINIRNASAILALRQTANSDEAQE